MDVDQTVSEPQPKGGGTLFSRGSAEHVFDAGMSATGKAFTDQSFKNAM